MVTGSFDTRSLDRNRELARECDDLGDISATIQACHILGDSAVRDIDSTRSSGKTVENKVCTVTVP